MHHNHCCAGCRTPSTKYAPVSHVIFDLDGTIINSEPVYVKAIKNAVERYGARYEPDFILKVQGRIEQDLAKIAVAHFNLPCTEEEFLKIYNENANKYLGDLELMPGAERIIRNLHRHNVPICIATSSGQASFDLKTQKFQDLIDCFDHIVCGGTDPEITRGKPSPDIFLVAASRFRPPTKPRRCLVFEDSVNGLKAGIAAGMQVVMIPDPNVAYEEWKEATMRLDSFNYMLPEFFDLPGYPEGEVAEELVGTRVEEVDIDASALVESMRRDLMSFGQPLARSFREYQQRFGAPMRQDSNSTLDDFGRPLQRVDDYYAMKELEFEENYWPDDGDYYYGEETFDGRGEFGWDWPQWEQEGQREGMDGRYGVDDGRDGWKWPLWKRDIFDRPIWPPEESPYAVAIYDSGRQEDPRGPFGGVREDSPYAVARYQGGERDSYPYYEDGRAGWPQWDEPGGIKEDSPYAVARYRGGPQPSGRERDPDRYYEGRQRARQDVGEMGGAINEAGWQWPQWERERDEKTQEHRVGGAGKDWQWPQWERDRKLSPDSHYYEGGHGRVPEDGFGTDKAGWQWPQWERDKALALSGTVRKTQDRQSPQWERDRKEMGGARYYEGGRGTPAFAGPDQSDRQWPQWERDRKVQQTPGTTMDGPGEGDWRWPQWERERKNIGLGDPGIKNDARYYEDGQRTLGGVTGAPALQWPQWERERKHNADVKRDPRYFDGGRRAPGDPGGRGTAQKDWQWPQWERERNDGAGVGRDRQYYAGGNGRAPGDVSAVGAGVGETGWQWPQWDRERRDEAARGKDPRYHEGVGPPGAFSGGVSTGPRKDWQWPQWEREKRNPRFYGGGRPPGDAMSEPGWPRENNVNAGPGRGRSPRLYDGAGYRSPGDAGVMDRTPKDWQRERRDGQKDPRFYEGGRTPGEGMGGPSKPGWQWPQWERDRNDKMAVSRERDPSYPEGTGPRYLGDRETSGGLRKDWQWPQWERERRDAGGQKGGATGGPGEAGWQWPQWDRERSDKAGPGGERDARYYEGAGQRPPGDTGTSGDRGTGRNDWQWPQWERERRDEGGRTPGEMGGPGWQWPQWDRERMDNTGPGRGRDPRYYGEAGHRLPGDTGTSGGRKDPRFYEGGRPLGDGMGGPGKSGWQWPQWERERKDIAGGQKDPRFYEGAGQRPPGDTGKFGGREMDKPRRDWQWPQWERERRDPEGQKDSRFHEDGRLPGGGMGGPGKAGWQWPQWDREGKDNAGPGRERDPRYYERAGHRPPGDTGRSGGGETARKDWQWPQWERDRRDPEGQNYSRFHEGGRSPGDGMGGPGKAGWQWPQWDRERSDKVGPGRYYEGAGQRPPGDTGRFGGRETGGPRKDLQWPQWERERRDPEGQKDPRFHEGGRTPGDGMSGPGRPGWQWPQWERERKDNAGPASERDPRYYGGAGQRPPGNTGRSDGGETGRKDWQWPQWERERKDANGQKDPRFYEGGGTPGDRMGGPGKAGWQWPQWERESKDNAGPGRERETSDGRETGGLRKDWQWPQWERDRKDVNGQKDPRFYEGGRTPGDGMGGPGGKVGWQWPHWEREKNDNVGPGRGRETSGGRETGGPRKDWQWPQWERERRDDQKDPRFYEGGRTPGDGMGGPGKTGWEWPQWERERKDNAGPDRERETSGARETGGPRKDWQWPQWERERRDEQKDPRFYEGGRAPEGDGMGGPGKAGWQWPQWERERKDIVGPGRERETSGGREMGGPRKDWQWPQGDVQIERRVTHERALSVQIALGKI